MVQPSRNNHPKTKPKKHLSKNSIVNPLFAAICEKLCYVEPPHVFGKGKEQVVLRGRSHHLAGGVLTKLGDMSVRHQ